MTKNYSYFPLKAAMVALSGTAIALCVSLSASAGGPSPPPVTATKTDSVDSARPGDRLTYRVDITNTTGAAIENVELSDTLDPNTMLVSGSVTAWPIAAADNYSISGNTTLGSMFISAANGLLANDVDPNGGSVAGSCAEAAVVCDVTPQTGLATIPAGTGTVDINADGSFTYFPAVGNKTTATFTYEITDAEGKTDTGTVSIMFPNLIWYVDNSKAMNGNGTIDNPFNNLASAASASAAGDMIYVLTGSAPAVTGLNAGITLKNNQMLLGQGVDLKVTFDGSEVVKFSAGTAPVITHTAGTAVALAQNNTIKGLKIGDSTNSVIGAGITGTTVGNLTIENASVHASTGAAVNINGGNLAVSFTSVSANGGSNGIVLQNTTGSFTVNGDGTNTAVGGNGSGGTISNMSGSDGTTAGIGVHLNNAANVTLRRMTINGTNQNYGIKGLLVNGFVLEYSSVSGTNGTASSLPAPENYGEGAIYFGNATTNGVVGTATFTNNNISGGRGRNLSIVNTAAGTTTLTVKGNTFGAIQNFTTGGHSLAVEARVSSGVIINTTLGGTNPGEPNTFTSAVGDLVNFTGQDNTTMDVVMRNNTLSNNNPSNTVGGGSLTLATLGTMTFQVTGNTMRDANGSAVTLFKGSALSGTPSMSGVFSNNTIGVSGVAGSGSMTGNGIFVSAGGTGTMTYTIMNNTILQYLGNAAIYADNTGGSYTANFTITGNTAAQPGASAFAGLALTAGAPSSSDDIDVCANVTGNNFSAGDPTNSNDVILGVSTGPSSMRLPGYVGSTLMDVQNFVLGNNNVAGTVVTAYADAPATAANFVGGAACSTP
ncbi:MAG: beta strand repeat-containing protein [Gammaproteobacteria bacterium]